METSRCVNVQSIFDTLEVLPVNNDNHEETKDHLTKRFTDICTMKETTSLTLVMFQGAFQRPSIEENHIFRTPARKGLGTITSLGAPASLRRLVPQLGLDKT